MTYLLWRLTAIILFATMSIYNTFFIESKEFAWMMLGITAWMLYLVLWKHPYKKR
jgi:hypothetical protein